MKLSWLGDGIGTALNEQSLGLRQSIPYLLHPIDQESAPVPLEFAGRPGQQEPPLAVAGQVFPALQVSKTRSEDHVNSLEITHPKNLEDQAARVYSYIALLPVGFRRGLCPWVSPLLFIALPFLRADITGALQRARYDGGRGFWF
jgi:hypothetical protein